MITKRDAETCMQYIISMYEIKERIKLYQQIFYMASSAKKEGKISRLRQVLSTAINHLKSLYKALQRGYNDFQLKRPPSKGSMYLGNYSSDMDNYLKENWKVEATYGKILIYVNPNKTKYSK